MKKKTIKFRKGHWIKAYIWQSFSYAYKISRVCGDSFWIEYHGKEYHYEYSFKLHMPLRAYLNKEKKEFRFIKGSVDYFYGKA